MNTPFSRKLLVTAIASAALMGCGGGSSSDNKDSKDPAKGDEVTVQRVSLTGLAVKGLLRDAPVRATTLDGRALQSTRTNQNGLYKLNDIKHDGPVLVTLTTDGSTQAKCDAVNGCGNGVEFGDFYPFNDSAFILTAVLPSAQLAKEQPLMVTPVTHLAAQRVVKNGDTDPDKIEGTLRATAKLIGLEGVNINAEPPADVTDPEDMQAASTNEQKYGAVLAAIATVAEEDDNKTVAQVVNILAEDYASDGGLPNNDDDEIGNDNPEVVSLEDIFEESGEVLEKAQDVADDAGVQVDTTQAEQAIEQQETQAENAGNTENKPSVEPVEPTPAPVPDEVQEPEPEPEPEPSITKAQATAKALTLLEDLNIWYDALADENNQTVTAPYETQVNATGELMSAVDDTSSLISTFHQYVIDQEINAGQRCFFDGVSNPCYEYEEVVTEEGPILGAVDFAIQLASFTNFIRQNAPEGATSYTLAEAITNGYDAGFTEYVYNDQIMDVEVVAEDDITDLTAMFAAMPAVGARNNVVYNLTYSDDDGAGRTGNASAVLSTSVVDAENKAVIRLHDFSVAVVTPSDSEEQSFYVSKRTDANEFGLVTLTYQDEASLTTFLTTGDNKETDLKAMTADFNSLVTDVDPAGSDTVDKSAELTVDLDFTSVVKADDATKHDVTLNGSIAIDAAVASTSESLNGTFTLTSTNVADVNNNVLTDTTSGETSTETVLDIATSNIDVGFSGEVNAKGTSIAGNEIDILFDGSIAADGDFFRSAVTDDSHAENAQASLTVTNLQVTETVAGTPQTTKLENAQLSVTAGVLKLPNGEVFLFDGQDQYNVTQMSLAGKLTTTNASGTASIDVNAVVNMDIGGLSYTNVTLPEEGEQIGTLDYTLTTPTAGTLRIAPDLFEAEREIAQAFVAVGAVPRDPAETPTEPLGYLEATIDQCIDGAPGWKYCRSTIGARAIVHEETPAGLTSEQKAAYALQAAQEIQYVDEYNSLSVPERLPFAVTAGAVNIDECVTSGGGHCNVTTSYNSTENYTFPAALAELEYSTYLKGLVTKTYAEDLADYTLGSCSNDATSWSCGLTELYSDDRHNPELATMADPMARNQILQGFGLTKRGLNTNYCTTEVDGSASCNVDVYSYHFSVFVTPEQALAYNSTPSTETAAPIIAAIDQASIPAFGQTTADGQIDYCDSFSGRCELRLPSVNTTLSIPATVPHDFYLQNAYIAGTYPANVIENVICDAEMCSWDIRKEHTVNYQSVSGVTTPLAENEVVALHLGFTEGGNLGVATTCDQSGNSCAVQISRSSYRNTPVGATTENITAYVNATLESENPITEPVSYDFSLPCDEYEYNGYTWCPAFVVTSTKSGFTPVPDVTTDTQLLRGSLDLAIQQTWGYSPIYAHYEFGDNDVDYMTDVSGLSTFLTATTDMAFAAPITLLYHDVEFDPEQFETESAYAQLSASLMVNGAVTSFDDASINIFAQRTGKEDAKGHIRFSYGARTIDLEIDSLAADLSDVAKNRLIIKNQDTEMVINVDCVNSDSGFSNSADKACAGDLRFSGVIKVADLDIGRLEDRAGIPTFVFDSGEKRELVVVPNFMIQAAQ